MISVIIGADEKRFESISGLDERWIANALGGREGGPVCIKVHVETPDLEIGFASPGCPSSGGGGGGPLSEKQKEVVTLWEKHHLNQNAVAPGNLISFFKDLKTYL